MMVFETLDIGQWRMASPTMAPAFCLWELQAGTCGGDGQSHGSLSGGDTKNLERPKQPVFTEQGAREQTAAQREDSRVSWDEKACPVFLSRMQSTRPLAKPTGSSEFLGLSVHADRRTTTGQPSKSEPPLHHEKVMYRLCFCSHLETYVQSVCGFVRCVRSTFLGMDNWIKS